MVDLAKAIGRGEKNPTTEVVGELILSELDKRRVEIAARRVFHRCQLRHNLSLPKEEISRISSQAEMRKAIAKKALWLQESHFSHDFSEEASNIFDTQMAAIEEAVTLRSVVDALRFLPGRELLAKLAPLMGVTNQTHLINVAAEHIYPDDYPELKFLRVHIRRRQLEGHAPSN